MQKDDLLDDIPLRTWERKPRNRFITNLRGLPNLLPDDLPLVVLVILDGLQQRCALGNVSPDLPTSLIVGERTKVLTSSSAKSA